MSADKQGVITMYLYSEAVKRHWGKGVWANEKDAVAWVDITTGLDCLIYRNDLGNLCGYVGVKEGTVLHGTKYDDGILDAIECHGGLSFSGEFSERFDQSAIAQLVESKNIWWFGFDCAHAWDLVPALAVMPRRYGLNFKDAEYRDMDYVAEQVRNMASQLAKINCLDMASKTIKRLTKKE